MGTHHSSVRLRRVDDLAEGLQTPENAPRGERDDLGRVRVVRGVHLDLV